MALIEACLICAVSGERGNEGAKCVHVTLQNPESINWTNPETNLWFNI